MSTHPVRHKKTVSVTLEPALLYQAREAGINLSATLAAALQSELRGTQAEQWKSANHKTMQELNRITDEYGLLSDDHRTF